MVDLGGVLALHQECDFAVTPFLLEIAGSRVDTLTAARLESVMELNHYGADLIDSFLFHQPIYGDASDPVDYTGGHPLIFICRSESPRLGGGIGNVNFLILFPESCFDWENVSIRRHVLFEHFIV